MKAHDGFGPSTINLGGTAIENTYIYNIWHPQHAARSLALGNLTKSLAKLEYLGKA